MNKGFSLVELIVVIAIMAILVGVAVPVYTSYITSANEKVDAQYVDELKRAVDTLKIDIEAGLTDEYADIDAIPTELTWDASGVSADTEYDDFMAALADLIDLSVAPKAVTETSISLTAN